MPHFFFSFNTFNTCRTTGFFCQTYDRDSAIVNFILTLRVIIVSQSKLLQYLKMQKVGYFVSFKKDIILPRLGCIGSEEDI